MTSKMISFIVFAVLTIAIFIVGSMFFRKTAPRPYEPPPLVDKPVEVPVSQKDKIYNMAANFATAYYSYSWGSFSNAESQYYLMTEPLKIKEEIRISKLKQQSQSQPHRYFTVRATVTGFSFSSFENEKAKVNMILNIDNIAGEAVQRETMIWVDSEGKQIGDKKWEDLVISSDKKNITLDVIKLDKDWQISNIEAD